MAYEEINIEVKSSCPLCAMPIVVRGRCEIDLDVGVMVDSSGQNDLHEDTVMTDPYIPLLPNIASINNFMVVGRFGEKEFLSNGNICFLKRPPYLFTISQQEKDEPKDYTEVVLKWRGNNPVYIYPAKANNARVALTKHKRENYKAIVLRVHVDVFRAIYPACQFMVDDDADLKEGKGIIMVYSSGDLVGAFTCLKDTTTHFEAAPSPDDPGQP